MFNINSKPYQQTAIRWALLKEQGFYNNCGECQSTGKPGLIADEMGLGKTIMMLGTWVGNFQRNTLIVVPSALLNQWEELIFKWLGIRALVFHGKKSKMSEEDIKQYHIVLPIKLMAKDSVLCCGIESTPAATHKTMQYTGLCNHSIPVCTLLLLLNIYLHVHWCHHYYFIKGVNRDIYVQ